MPGTGVHLSRPLCAAVSALVFGAVAAGCSSTRPLTAEEREMVLTVQTLRDGGVLVPVPFAEKYVTEARTTRYDGSAVLLYRFDPPDRENFPVFFESQACLYRIPGQAAYGEATFVLGLSLDDDGYTEHRTIDLGIVPDADLVVFRQGDGTVSAFIVYARAPHNRLLIITMAGAPAAVPEYWFDEIRGCLNAMRDYRSGDGAAGGVEPTRL